MLLFGVCTIGFRPVSFSYGVELTFPMQPSITNGIMAFLANFIAVVLSIVVNWMTDGTEEDLELEEDHLEEVR